MAGPFYPTERAARRAFDAATTYGGVAGAPQMLPDGTWAAVLVLTETQRCWSDHYRGRGVHVLARRPLKEETP